MSAVPGLLVLDGYWYDWIFMMDVVIGVRCHTSLCCIWRRAVPGLLVLNGFWYDWIFMVNIVIGMGVTRPYVVFGLR